MALRSCPSLVFERISIRIHLLKQRTFRDLHASHVVRTLVAGIAPLENVDNLRSPDEVSFVQEREDEICWQPRLARRVWHGWESQAR